MYGTSQTKKIFVENYLNKEGIGTTNLNKNTHKNAL